jgi:ferredoxin-NADP reductase
VTTLGRYVGLLAGVQLLVQVVLASRLPWLDRRWSLQRLTRWHAVNGTVLPLTVLAHVTLVLGGGAALTGLDPVTYARLLLQVNGPVVLAAVAAGMLLLVWLVSALRAVRVRLPHEVWRALHASAYVAVGLTLPHQLLVGSDLVAHRWARWAWVTAFCAAGLAMLAGRVIGPILASRRLGLRVLSVCRESDRVFSVWLSCRPGAASVHGGQVLFLRFLERRLVAQVHPLSASLVDGDQLRVTVRVDGGWTARLVAVRPGTRVLAAGPYGGFIASSARTPGPYLVVAGGSGITAVRGLVDDLGKAGRLDACTLVHRASSLDQMVFTTELARLRRCGLVSHHLVGHRDDPSTGLADVAALRALVPGVEAHEAFVCGSRAFVGHVRRLLRHAGLPPARIHVECYTLG